MTDDDDSVTIADVVDQLEGMTPDTALAVLLEFDDDSQKAIMDELDEASQQAIVAAAQDAPEHDGGMSSDETVPADEVLAWMETLPEHEQNEFFRTLPEGAQDVLLAEMGAEDAAADADDFERQLDDHLQGLGRKMTPREVRGVLAMVGEQHAAGEFVDVAGALETFNERTGRKPIDMDTPEGRAQYGAERLGMGKEETEPRLSQEDVDMDDPAQRQAWVADQLTPRLSDHAPALIPDDALPDHEAA